MLIYAIGKTRESYWRSARDEYLRRLRPFGKVELVLLPADRSRDASRRKNNEGLAILSRLTADDFFLPLVRGAGRLSSSALASLLANWQVQSKKIVFAIGGDEGLSEQVLRRADYQLSLSDLTFTHEMALVILLEQLYRALMICRGSSYHR